MGIELRGKNGAIDLSRKMWKGDDGGYYIPSLDSEGNLTWAPSEVEMPAVEGANIKGQKGDTGTSGVWVGDTEPTGDYNVWIDPTGSETTGLATKAELANKQDKLTPGDNITIDSNNIISTTGLATQAELASKQDKLTAGDNITINSDNVISTTNLVTQVELENKQDKLTAGDNITIDSNNVISSTQPTKTSELTNDSGFITNEYHDPAKQDKLVAGDNITLADDGTISASQPTKTSELTNDSGFITNEYHDATKQDKLTAGTNITIDSNNVISASGSGGGGSSYTFTDGLTETDGVVKWDLNDKIKPYNNSVGIGNFKESSNPSFENKGYYNLVIGKSEGNYSTYPMFRCDGSDGSILFGHVMAYKDDTSASIRVHTIGGGGNLAGGYVNCYDNSGGIELFGEGNIVIGKAQDGKLGCCGAGNIVIGSNEIGKMMIAGDNAISAYYCQAFGAGIQVFGYSSMAQGKYNILDRKSPNTYAHIVGNGTSDSARSNAYTLDWQGNGTFAGTVSSSTGADYAEYFEWKDGNPNNEDRVGYIVTLDGDKIVKANFGDDVLGICSGTAMVLGDSAEWNWSKRYLTDDFGRIIYEDYDVEHEEIKDENTGKVLEEAWTEHIHAPKQNPDYDTTKAYTKRADRPEWQIVGMMGKLYVRDDGSCVVNGYADVVNGIATKATGKTNMRVMERINDSIVRVLLK